MITLLTSEQVIERLRKNPADYVTSGTLLALAAQVDFGTCQEQMFYLEH